MPPAADYEEALKWYRWKSVQGASADERVRLLTDAINKYKPLGVDVSEAERELASVEGAKPGSGTTMTRPLWHRKRHGLGFALGTTAGTGFSYMYNFDTAPTISLQVGGLYLRDVQDIGTQLQVALAESIRTRLVAHIGLGYYAAGFGSSVTNFGFGLGIGTASWDVLTQMFDVEVVLRDSVTRPGTVTTSLGFNYTIHYQL